jgi:hypothetical protein
MRAAADDDDAATFMVLNFYTQTRSTFYLYFMLLCANTYNIVKLRNYLILRVGKKILQSHKIIWRVK